MVEGHQKWQNWTPAYYLSNKKSEHVVVHNFLRRIQKNVFWEGVRCLSSGSSWNSDVPAFTPSQNLHILVRDGQFSGGMHPQNSSTRGNKGLSEMPKFWQFFFNLLSIFWQEWDGKKHGSGNLESENGNIFDWRQRSSLTYTPTFDANSADDGRGKMLGRELMPKNWHRATPMQGCQFFGRPKLCAKGMPTIVNEESATVQQSRFYKNKKDIAEKVQYVWLDFKKNAQKGEGTLISRLWRPEKWKNTYIKEGLHRV